MNLAPYRKTLAAAVGAVLTWLTLTLTDNAVSTQEWIALGIALATALGVYGTPNETEVGKAPFKKDRGESFVWFLLLVAAVTVGILLAHVIDRAL